MSRRYIVGYCPELYRIIRDAVYTEVPFVSCDESPPFNVWRAEQERANFKRYLLEGFTTGHVSRSEEHVMAALYEAIDRDNDDLKEMVEIGTIVEFDVDRNGYYIAAEE